MLLIRWLQALLLKQPQSDKGSWEHTLTTYLWGWTRSVCALHKFLYCCFSMNEFLILNYPFSMLFTCNWTSIFRLTPSVSIFINLHDNALGQATNPFLTGWGCLHGLNNAIMFCCKSSIDKLLSSRSLIISPLVFFSLMPLVIG